MGVRSVLKEATRAIAGTAGSLLMDVATNTDLWKAKAKPDEGQERAPGGSQEDTADNAPVPTEQASEDPKALFWDPFAIIEQLGYKDKPSQISYGTLKAIFYKTPVVSAIVQTRIQQMASFCKPVEDRYDIGFRIKLRESKKQPSPQDTKWSQQMQSLMLRTGVTENPRGRDGFETFVRKIMWDSLVYDQMCFEVVPNSKGQPAEWYAVDASTIRIADSASTYVDEDDTDVTRHVQIYDGMVIAEWPQGEMCFGVRNPRADIRMFGYGTAELEILTQTVTALLWAWEYNQKAFSQGAVHKGILNFKGAIPDKQMKQFRRHFYTQLASVANAWRTPITNADDMQWISMHSNNRDMEYNAWMDFLIKVACSVFTIDPAEVNFQYGNTGQKSSFKEGSNKEKIIESKERGLLPLLRFLAQAINTYIIWPINEDFEFEFCGLDAKTRDEVADLNTKLVKSTRMVDELRAEDDLPPLANGEGQVILDPVWMQAKTMAQGGMPGEEGEGDEGPDFESMLGGDEGKDEDEDDGDEEETEKSMRRVTPYVVDIRL